MFRLFAGSILKNIDFNLFSKSNHLKGEMNDFVGLSDSYQVSSHGKNLSQGQQQKTLILRAISQVDRDIFLLDERTSNLDKKSKDRLVASLFELKKKGKIICVVTHDADLIAIASKIIK